MVAFRRHTLLPLDDCLYALQATIPHLTRSSLHRCLQRHGISRLLDVEGDKPARRKFKPYPIGSFHIDIAEVRTAEGKALLSEVEGLHLYVGIDRTSKFAFVQFVKSANRVTASAFLKALIEGGIQFTFPPRYADAPPLATSRTCSTCAARKTGSSTASPRSNIPWTNGQVERMNRTIKEAIVNRYH